MILFAVIDILGAIPVVIDLGNRMGEINARKATLFLALLWSCFFFGESI